MSTSPTPQLYHWSTLAKSSGVCHSHTSAIPLINTGQVKQCLPLPHLSYTTDQHWPGQAVSATPTPQLYHWSTLARSSSVCHSHTSAIPLVNTGQVKQCLPLPHLSYTTGQHWPGQAVSASSTPQLYHWSTLARSSSVYPSHTSAIPLVNTGQVKQCLPLPHLSYTIGQHWPGQAVSATPTPQLYHWSTLARSSSVCLFHTSAIPLVNTGQVKRCLPLPHLSYTTGQHWPGQAVSTSPTPQLYHWSTLARSSSVYLSHTSAIPLVNTGQVKRCLPLPHLSYTTGQHWPGQAVSASPTPQLYHWSTLARSSSVYLSHTSAIPLVNTGQVKQCLPLPHLSYTTGQAVSASSTPQLYQLVSQIDCKCVMAAKYFKLNTALLNKCYFLSKNYPAEEGTWQRRVPGIGGYTEEEGPWQRRT